MRPTLAPCPHRELRPGPLATPADLATWSAELAAQPCPACAARPNPTPAAPDPAPLPPLPPDVAHALAADGRAAALRAQRTLEVPASLHGAIAARLAAQPGTSPWWRRWWASWRGGALLVARPV